MQRKRGDTFQCAKQRAVVSSVTVVLFGRRRALWLFGVHLVRWHLVIVPR